MKERLGLMVVTHTTAYLRECLDSVAAQTVRPSEIVVIDNASPESPAAQDIAREFGYATIRLDEPRTAATARNTACEFLVGCELIVNLDGDDELRPQFIETYWEAAERRPSDIVYGAGEFFGLASGPWYVDAHTSLRPLRNGNFLPANALFRRQLWHEVGGFDPEIVMCSDFDFWLSCARQDPVVEFVPNPLWRYRRHTTSMSMSATPEARAAALRVVRRKHTRFIDGRFQWRRPIRLFRRIVGSRLQKLASRHATRRPRTSTASPNA